MKGIQIRIATDNAIFAEDYPGEVARILRRIAARVEAGPTSLVQAGRVSGLPVHDFNDNWVGEAKFGVELPRGWPKRG